MGTRLSTEALLLGQQLRTLLLVLRRVRQAAQPSRHIRPLRPVPFQHPLQIYGLSPQPARAASAHQSLVAVLRS